MEVAAAKLRVLRNEIARRRDYRLGLVVIVLLLALTFVISALFIVSIIREES